MRTGPSAGDDEANILITRVPSAAASLAVVPFLAGLLVADGFVVRWLAEHSSGAARVIGIAAAVAVGLLLLPLVERHMRHVVGWLRWRGKPVSALRWTPDGISYSPAYTGGFPYQVFWAMPMECAYRQGPGNRGFVWCLYTPVVEGLGTLPALLDREWPLSRSRLVGERRALIQECGVDQTSSEQMVAVNHLVYYGTPIVVNPYLVDRVRLQQFDAYLRERTDGRCTVAPPDRPVTPTTTAK
ncbi:hypothetical protein [Cryptosporangium sp. NPDC048952]|uniref:hypothetical protein n=1 Tax=Cryptosporangium sp. NPDC048952 TaxID=3363961 RepID=UPI0037232171